MTSPLSILVSKSVIQLSPRQLHILRKMYESRNMHAVFFGVIGRLLIYVSTVSIIIFIVLVSWGVSNVGGRVVCCLLSVNEPTKTRSAEFHCCGGFEQGQRGSQ
jgi:hypothetical protein